MRSRWGITLFAVVLLISPAAARAESATSVSRFSGSAAKQQVDALAVQIGSRPAGSAAYEQAVAYVQGQLQAWGYAPTLQSFPVTVFNDRGSSVDSADATGASTHFAADTLQYSIAGQVRAPLVAAGRGDAQDFANVDARGKIALMQRGVTRFSDKVANAAAAGALGAIIYNDDSGRVQGTLANAEPIPAATISGDSGQQLLGMLADQAVSASLSVDASTDQESGTNVIADLPGNGSVAGTVIFTAHLDSVPAGPGANDNGSGSAVVLELAHELAQRTAAERPVSVRFALFGAEELGLDGSQYYIQQLSDTERQAVRADVNLDMVGVGDQWRFGGTDDLVQVALGAANDLGQRALPLRGALAGASDHASFLGAGIPAVFLYRVEDPNYHTAGDVASLVDPDALAQAGTIALRILDDLDTK